MTTPPMPSTPVLMVALTVLAQSTWQGRRPDVQAGQSFWARHADHDGLVAGNLARDWQPGDPAAPSIEPPWTVHGQPGLAKGTTNASH
jgi:hypothetical protein